MNIIENFSLIRKDYPEIDRSKLPEKIPELVSTSEDMIDLFNIALEYWNAIFSPDQIIEKIQRYIEMNSEEKMEDFYLKKYFKDLRKAGLILGAACKFFNINPSLPSEFIMLLRFLGRMSDTYGSEESVGFARHVLSIVEKSDLIVVQLDVTTKDEFMKRFEAIFDNTKAMLGEERISVEEYHEFRKDLRHLMNLFQLAAAKNPDNKVILQVFQYICDLNSELGAVHDKYSVLKINEPELYRATKMGVSKELKEKIELFIHYYKNRFE